MKFIDIFAGIGGFHSGMSKAGHTCVGYIEWNKFARKSYEAIYDTKGIYTANDISKIENGKELPEADIWCFGSPCQNISLAGKGEGIQGKQSSMFFEVMRLLEDRQKEQRPLFLFMENVKNLLSINGGRDFARVLIEMDKRGYDVEWQVVNSSWCIPQNRERVFIIGHKRGRLTHQVFPLTSNEINSERKYKILRDALEENVDEKYYLSPEKTRQLVVTDKKIMSNNSVNQIGKLARKTKFKNPQVGRIYSDYGLSPTLNTMQGGDREPKILVKPCLTPNRINKRQNGRRFKNNDDPMFTLNCQDKHGVLFIKKSTNYGVSENIRIRKLTPLECWRLQGFTDEQFFKAKNAGLSNSQLYKQAGNAVTVPVIYAIAKRF